MYIWYVFAMHDFVFAQLVQWRNLYALQIHSVIALQVCATERIKIQPHLLEQLIGCCQGDIRKILMQLQFWCQGRRSRKGKLDVVHHKPMPVFELLVLILHDIIFSSFLFCCS